MCFWNQAKGQGRQQLFVKGKEKAEVGHYNHNENGDNDDDGDADSDGDDADYDENENSQRMLWWKTSLLSKFPYCLSIQGCMLCYKE